VNVVRILYPHGFIKDLFRGYRIRATFKIMSGHNPNKNYQSEEHQDVEALLRGLPQVKAPTNFDALLKARIAQAKVEQKADVTALLQELPRVAVPADFDFKLRARIANAKSEKSAPLGWFSEVFGRTFSWAQAGVAMAAVALFVGVFSFQMMKPVDNPESQTTAKNEQNKVVPQPSGSIAVVQPSVSNEIGKVDVAASSPSPIRNSNASAVAVKFAPARPKTQAQSPKTGNRSVEVIASPAPENREDLIASNTVLIKHSSGETRVVKVAEVSFGLQSASLRTNAAREDRGNNMELASAQIVY
jgi:hypothetical protein